MITVSGPTLLQLLLLGGLQCRGDRITSVTQWPPFQVTLTNRPVNINCNITCMNSPECANFTLNFYKLDSEGKEVPLAGYPKNIHPAVNTTACSVAFLWDSSVQDTYYCSATWQSESKKGGGTFIDIRDEGYRLLQEGYWSLHFCLIAISSILVVLGCAETVALLLWKKKGYPLWSHEKSDQKDTCQQEVTPCTSRTVETCRASDIYTSLQPCQANIYDVIEEGACAQPKKKDLPGPIPKSASDSASNFDDVYENL
ncbi:NFAT activation molecule 1 isoform X2 [Microcaecilia unicolor]|uniref:NFAT activation molecule 1 isoform X2 n=1 Tax=Microcaecilia unicolor TaxID=1415580 RepID=A0A6P7WSE2_9AMPH|nr:NFAT activation molecule 1 isoform X2 [Microcaecilia unicolor]